MSELMELVKNEKWEEAWELAENLRRTGEESEEFMILYATVCGAQGSAEKEYEEICHGLQKYPMNYELYYMLGHYYMGQQRSSLAYLCYEQANHYCEGQDDRQMIEESMGVAAGQPDFEVNPVSFIILAEDDVRMLRDAVQSVIRNECGTSYEILVIDNRCQGDALEWLREYRPVRVIPCPEKTGFAGGINLGVESAQVCNDIYLMSSDAILQPNTLFWLRMCLYERDTVGAAGGISNAGSGQQRIDLTEQMRDDYVLVSKVMNVPDRYAHENKVCLEAFSLLIKRKALESAGMFEGEDATDRYCCVDYGMKLTKAGYEQVVCYNSFIYRQVSSGNGYISFHKEDFDRFKERWGFSVPYYSASRQDLIEKIRQPQQEEIWVLEVGCGCGSTLSAIRCQYPNAHVYGIELMEEVAACGKYMADIIAGNIETMELPYEEHVFDYIMFGDVLEHLRDPGKVVERMKKYLRPDGRILASIPNVMNIEIVVDLLKGNFKYRNAGLLDRTHIHLFTLREIERMFKEAGYVLVGLEAKCLREGHLEKNEENERIIEAIYRIPGIADQMEFETYQYLVEVAPGGA